jgi:hypothetical protein
MLKDINIYQSMFRWIIYLVTGIQSDLTFAIFFLAQFSYTPNKQYVVARKCSLRYIKGIRNLTLLFPYSAEMFTAGFSDSDYSHCIDSRKSVSDSLFKLGNSTIS